MSGGSFDYLYCAETLGSERTGDIERMAAELERLGHHDAAERTRTVLAAIAEAERLRTELEGVWREVEWFVSCDSGKDDVAEAVNRWRQGKPAVEVDPEIVDRPDPIPCAYEGRPTKEREHVKG